MATIQKIVPHLWFSKEAEEAVNFYVSVFEDASIGRITRYTEAGYEIHKMPAGSVMTIEFRLAGQEFLALNGGPNLQFNEAVSFMIYCDTQEEIDHYWNKLTEGGDPKAQECGWLKDKFGLSWQVVPSVIPEMLLDKDPAKVKEVTQTILQMKKPDLGKIQKAYQSVATV
jgi:predicted 3-demethylubiquinone-9 3-methyltransferase (glyoxalase superfamily)